jgi:hypothetical protein
MAGRRKRRGARSTGQREWIDPTLGARVDGRDRPLRLFDALALISISWKSYKLGVEFFRAWQAVGVPAESTAVSIMVICSLRAA